MTARQAVGRRARTTAVDAILEELDRARRRLYVLKAHGVRAGGLRDLKADLVAAQRRLATLDRRTE